MMKLSLVLLAASSTHAFHVAPTRSYHTKLGMVSYLDQLSYATPPPTQEDFTQPELVDALEATFEASAEECNPYTGECIPAGMDFIASPVVTDTIEIPAGSETAILSVGLDCVSPQVYYAGFTADSHPAFKVQPNYGTLEPGKTKGLLVTCDPDVQGEGQDYGATLVLNVPGANTQLTYSVSAPMPAHHHHAGNWGAGRDDEEIKASTRAAMQEKGFDIDHDLNVDAYSLGAVGGIMPGVQLTGLCGDD